MNATDVVLLYHLSSNYSYGVCDASSSIVSFFYTSPVNKRHLFHPTTEHSGTCTHTHTHTGRQSHKLTFTHQQLTKGHEGLSFKSIYLVWIASVYMASHSGRLWCRGYGGPVFPPLAFCHPRPRRYIYSRLTKTSLWGELALISSVSVSL